MGLSRKEIGMYSIWYWSGLSAVSANYDTDNQAHGPPPSQAFELHRNYLKIFTICNPVITVARGRYSNLWW